MRNRRALRLMKHSAPSGRSEQALSLCPPAHRVYLRFAPQCFRLLLTIQPSYFPKLLH